MNKQNEMIRKSLHQMKEYLNLYKYKMVLKTIDYNSFLSTQVSIKVLYETKELRDDMPKIYLYYCFNSFNKSTIEKIIEGATLNTKDILLIITTDYSSTINDLLRSKYSQFYINLYKIQQLQYNILEHSFVPQHIKLNDTEKMELYKKYNILNDKQLPQISRFDPVACAIFLRPGEVCKIIRHDKISLQNDFYRICVG